MLGSHCRVLEGFVQLFLHALVLNHLVQLRLTMIFNVAIGCLNGLACQQRSAEHGQECAPVAPLDAVDQDVVAVPHGALHCWPDVCPLLRSLLAVSRCKSHELSAWQGHPPGSQDHWESSRSAARGLGSTGANSQALQVEV